MLKREGAGFSWMTSKQRQARVVANAAASVLVYLNNTCQGAFLFHRMAGLPHTGRKSMACKYLQSRQASVSGVSGRGLPHCNGQGGGRRVPPAQHSHTLVRRADRTQVHMILEQHLMPSCLWLSYCSPDG